MQNVEQTNYKQDVKFERHHLLLSIVREARRFDHENVGKRTLEPKCDKNKSKGQAHV